MNFNAPPGLSTSPGARTGDLDIRVKTAPDQLVVVNGSGFKAVGGNILHLDGSLKVPFNQDKAVSTQ